MPVPAEVARAARTLWKGTLDGVTQVSVRLAGTDRTIRGVEGLAQWLQFTQGQLRGIEYRLRGRAPAADAPDDVLADRVRTRLGPVLRDLDLPRVHVSVSDGVAALHGDVADGRQVDKVIAATREVPGIRDVDSHLHVGLTPGDTRPSTGRRQVAPSYQLARLTEAAEAAGVKVEQAGAALQVLLERLPAGERDHVINHLRGDVRRLVAGPAVPDDVLHVRDVDTLVGIVARFAVLSERRARRTLEAVMVVLAELVPEEVADISAVLPSDLRALWMEVTTEND